MKKIIFILSSILVFYISCNSIKEPEYRDIKDVRIMNISMLESTAEIDMIYYNPNGFGVLLSEASGEVFVDSTFFGRFSMDEEVKVPKHSEFLVPGILKIDMIAALKNGQTILSKKEALVKINGTAKVKKAGVAVNVPIRFEGMQNIEKFRQLLLK
jgi:LEA14-like dessication related protein